MRAKLLGCLLVISSMFLSGCSKEDDSLGDGNWQAVPYSSVSYSIDPEGTKPGSQSTSSNIQSTSESSVSPTKKSEVTFGVSKTTGYVTYTVNSANVKDGASEGAKYLVTINYTVKNDSPQDIYVGYSSGTEIYDSSNEKLEVDYGKGTDMDTLRSGKQKTTNYTVMANQLGNFEAMFQPFTNVDPVSLKFPVTQ